MSWLTQINNKILTDQEIDSFLESHHRIGNRIVFTNGCFDILHKGHVEYLAQAADLGDVLIVGVNSDDSVKRLEKGDERPVNPITARLTLLAALEFVGGVIEFDEDTPLELISRLKPDVLVKGGDYDPLESNPASKTYVVGRDVVLANGGEVKVIDLVPGFSTTNIVNQLKK